MSIKDLQTDQHPIEVQQLQARFLQIEKNLVEMTPELPVALAEIHKQLQQHEELIHLLDDEDLMKLHMGFEKYKQIEVFTKAVKATKSKKKLSDKELSDI